VPHQEKPVEYREGTKELVDEIKAVVTGSNTDEV
jgi:hypothetical protein